MRKKSKAERKRPQPPGLGGAQRVLDPPLRFLPQGSGAFKRLFSSGAEPHRRLALVLRRVQAHKPKCFERLHVPPHRRAIEFREAPELG